MHRRLVAFGDWAELLLAARNGVQLYYRTPMDAAQAYPAKSVQVVRVYKNGNLRIRPLSNQADAFTADPGHLNRFRRMTEAAE